LSSAKNAALFTDHKIEKENQIVMEQEKLVSKKTHASILLIEDNPIIQVLHKKMLENLGCKVDIAEHANHALKMLTKKYDLLFVDIGLPDIDGFELIKIIRKKHPDKQKMPIIALTGFSEQAELQHCMRVGANEVVVKPASNETLKKILLAYIV
jgi:CheY-like chemotaxis protein